MNFRKVEKDSSRRIAYVPFLSQILLPAMHVTVHLEEDARKTGLVLWRQEKITISMCGQATVYAPMRTSILPPNAGSADLVMADHRAPKSAIAVHMVDA